MRLATTPAQRARGAKIAEYERFIGERLTPDLAAAEGARGTTLAGIATWEGLITNVRGVQEARAAGHADLRTLVDLGTQVYCQAEVPDTSHLFVSVGLGFHAELTLEEAVAFAEKKLGVLRAELTRRVEQVADIQSHIKLVTEGIRELMNLTPDDGARDGAHGWSK